MKNHILQPLHAAGLCALVVLAGCASTVGGADPLGYAKTSCPDLNVMIADTSKSISSTAVSRGKIARVNVPFWVPGGDKAVSVLKDRRTSRIGKLEDQLEAMRSARQAKCS